MKKTIRFLLGFLSLNLLWLAGSLLLHTRAVPSPVEVYRRGGELFSADLARHIGASLYRIGAGLLLSLAAGLPAGLLMARSPRWNRFLHPLVYFAYPVPKTALLPVAMLLLGLGDGSKVLIIVLTIVFQVIVAVRDAALGIDAGFYHVAAAAGAGKRAVLVHITLPAILPGLLTSLRVGTGTALAVLFLVEAYGTDAGMGYYILDAWARINYIEMYGGILVISVVGAALFLALDLLAARLCRWNEPGEPAARPGAVRRQRR